MSEHDNIQTVARFDHNQQRGITIAPNGEQWDITLPKGNYHIVGIVNFTTPKCGFPNWEKRIMLVGPIGASNKRTYYVFTDTKLTPPCDCPPHDENFQRAELCKHCKNAFDAEYADYIDSTPPIVSDADYVAINKLRGID